MFYPLKFKPIFKEKIWGGNRMKSILNKDIDITKKIGESWELVDRNNENSIILNGNFAGFSLRELLSKYRKEVMGKYAEKYSGDFPLLIKFIEADDDLSVQVHPDDDIAREIEGDNGKTECWYIIDAKQNTKINYGLKADITKEKLIELINENRIIEALNIVDVKKDDFLYIPSGCIHAIMKGTILAEIQQNSDVTYRLYDWDRVGFDGKPRQLHIEKALKSIKFEQNMEILHTTNESLLLVDSEYFKVEKVVIEKESLKYFEFKEPMILMGIKGSGEVNEEKLQKGDTILLPAALEKATIKATLEELIILKINLR